MNDKTLLALLECDDEHVQSWFRDAVEYGWSDLDEIAEAAMDVHGELSGFWRCDSCQQPVVDPAFDIVLSNGLSDESLAVLLMGDITLCHECYEAAKDARGKIVVIEDEDGVAEDRSALTEEERELAELLDMAEEARNQADREMISNYPRREQRQLHRYQDDIELERFKEGKTT